MNIFYLDTYPPDAAKALYDKHAVKMSLEYTQILTTAAMEAGAPEWDCPYSPTHTHHPCVQWAASHVDNYRWLLRLAEATYQTYRFRYGNTHACEKVHQWCRTTGKMYLPEAGASKGVLRTEPPQCMPERFQCSNTVRAYRRYYSIGKRDLDSYTGVERPEWIDRIRRAHDLREEKRRIVQENAPNIY